MKTKAILLSGLILVTTLAARGAAPTAVGGIPVQTVTQANSVSNVLRTFTIDTATVQTEAINNSSNVVYLLIISATNSLDNVFRGLVSAGVLSSYGSATNLTIYESNTVGAGLVVISKTGSTTNAFEVRGTNGTTKVFEVDKDGNVRQWGALTVIGTTNASELVIRASAGQSNTNPMVRLQDSTGAELSRWHSDTKYNNFIGFEAGKANTPLNFGAGNLGHFNTFIGYRAGARTTTGLENTALGVFALETNTIGNYNVALGNDGLRAHRSGDDNLSIGYNTMYFHEVGDNNVAIGNYAINNSTNGNDNLGIGEYSLRNWQGNYALAIGNNTLNGITNAPGNLAIGYNSQGNNLVGGYNNAIGYYSLGANLSGEYNHVFGYEGLLDTTSGSFNTGMGFRVMENGTTAGQNTAVGWEALGENITGSGNVAVGYEAGRGVAGNSFSDNTLIGYRAGKNLSLGSLNVLIGVAVGDNITAGQKNIVIGYDIDAPSPTSTNAMSIGNLIFGTAVDGVGTNISSGSIGIGISEPQSKLHVNGGVTVTNGDLAIGTGGRVSYGNYATLSETLDGFTAVYGNNLAASRVTPNKMTKTANTIDPGQYISLSYDRGIRFGTGLGGGNAPGTEYNDDANERMRIDLTGKVGIGTNAPPKTLSVHGDLLVTSNVFLGKVIVPVGSTGNADISTVSGIVNFNVGALVLTVTSSIVDTNSIITAQVYGTDLTAKTVTVTPTNGSFALTLNAEPTAETKVAFRINN